MKKIKMAVMAVGNIAHAMASTMQQLDCIESYAVASREYQKASSFAKQYSFVKAYGSYEEMLADPEIELVYIASPHSHHFEHIKMCLEHGKHVLCEKAFTVNARQAEEVFAMAYERRLLLAEAMWVRYMPMVETLKEVIQSGVVGEISTLTANLHYEIDGVPRIQKPELAGGALLDVGVYTLTFASICFGNEIKTIHAAAVKTETGVDSQTAVTLCYQDGKMAVLNSGTMAISDRLGVIYGRDGYIAVENINNFQKIDVYSKERQLIQTYCCPKQISGYEYQVQACAKAIREGKNICPQMPPEQSVAIMKQMDEIRCQLGIVYPCE